MNDNLGNNIQIDTTGTDPGIGSGASKGSVGSILQSRNTVSDIFQKQSSSILGAQQDIKAQVEGIEALLKEVNNLGEDYSKTIAKQKEYKDLAKTLEDLKKVQAEINNLVENQNVKAEKLNAVYTNTEIALIKSKEASQELLDIHDETGKKLKEQTNEYKFQAEIRRQSSEAEIEALKTQQKETDKLLKESRKNLGEATKSAVGSLRSSLADLSQVLDLSKIANSVERSTRTILQEDLQRSFNISKADFNSLKGDINDSYDTSLYTQQEVTQAYESLSKLGINSKEEAEANFNTIIQGQSLVGMSAETQAELIGLGNTYNKDMLSFMTNRTAQYMQTATNISKQQLNELVALNINMAKDLADRGFDDPAVLENLNNATVALTNLNEGDSRYAEKYTAAMGEISNMDTNTLGAMFNMDNNEIRDYLGTAGNNLFTLFSRDGSTEVQGLVDAYRKGDYTTIDNLQSSFGTSDNVATLLKEMVRMEQEGINIQAEIQKQAASGDNEDALKDLDTLRNESLTAIQESMNSVNAFINETLDWAITDGILNSLTIMIGLLTAIEATLALQSITQMFGGKNGLSKLGTSVAGKWGGSKLIGAAATTAGIAGTAYLATNMIGGATSTATEMYGADATGGERVIGALAGGVSGSGVHYNDKGEVDVGKNGWTGALNGAGTGAAIGAFFGPWGAVIGGGIGAIAGGIGGLLKGSEAEKEQKKLQEEQLKVEEDIAKNTKALSDTSMAPTWANRLVSSYRPTNDTTIRESGRTPSPSVFGGSITAPQSRQSFMGNSSGFTGAQNQYVGNWRVSSGYGPRSWYRYDPNNANSIKDKNSKYYGYYLYSDNHTGIDLTAGGTQAIYSVSGGTAKVINNDRYGGNMIEVSDGKLKYTYAHMSTAAQAINGQNISPGTFLGYMGNTGNSDGQHLHFQVDHNGKPTHPVPHLSEMINTGDATAGKLVNYADWLKQNIDESLPFDLFGTEADPTKEVHGIKEYSTQLKNIGNSDPVVAGLSQINTTLIDLSNKQTEQEAILNMLSNKGKQNPIMG